MKFGEISCEEIPSPFLGIFDDKSGIRNQRPKCCEEQRNDFPWIVNNIRAIPVYSSLFNLWFLHFSYRLPVCNHSCSRVPKWDCNLSYVSLLFDDLPGKKSGEFPAARHVKGDTGTVYVNMLPVLVFMFLFNVSSFTFDVFCAGDFETILVLKWYADVWFGWG